MKNQPLPFIDLKDSYNARLAARRRRRALALLATHLLKMLCAVGFGLLVTLVARAGSTALAIALIGTVFLGFAYLRLQR